MGLDLIDLCQRDKWMKICLKSIKKIIEEEKNKSSDKNAKSSFLLDQVNVTVTETQQWWY